MKSGVCRICGCTDNNACPEGCSWADGTYTICSNPICLKVARRDKKAAAAARRMLRVVDKVLSYHRGGENSPVPSAFMEELRSCARNFSAKGGAA